MRQPIIEHRAAWNNPPIAYADSLLESLSLKGTESVQISVYIYSARASVHDKLYYNTLLAFHRTSMLVTRYHAISSVVIILMAPKMLVYQIIVM